jgi:hypothetical protein
VRLRGNLHIAVVVVLLVELGVYGVATSAHLDVLVHHLLALVLVVVVVVI